MYQEVITAAKEKMQKTNSVLQAELRTIRAGRANPQLLDRVMVDYYGVPTPLPQMGNVVTRKRTIYGLSELMPRRSQCVLNAIRQGLTKLRQELPIAIDDRLKDIDVSGRGCSVGIHLLCLTHISTGS